MIEPQKAKRDRIADISPSDTETIGYETHHGLPQVILQRSTHKGDIAKID